MPFEFAFFLGSTTRSPVFWCAMILGLMYPIYGVQGALTTGEIAALEQLYHNFPGLATAHRRIIEFPQDDYFGKAWTTNFTSYCDHGEGYGFNGIYCHDGHVSGITANQQWGDWPIPQANFSHISGLQNLTNITVTPPFFTLPTLISAIVQALPVQHIQGGSTLVSEEFTYPAAVLSMEGGASSTFNISAFTNLQVLRLIYLPSPSIIDTWVWPYDTLEVLEFGIFDQTNLLPISWWLDQYPLFPSLRVLKGTWLSGSDGIPIPALLNSSTLETLDINVRDDFTPVNLTILCPACLDVTVTWGPNSTVNITAPALQKLSLICWSWPDLYTPLPSLIELNLHMRNGPPTSMPSMDFAPAMSSFSLSYFKTNSSTLVRILGSLPTTLKSLSLSEILVDQLIEIPNRLNSLTSVTLSSTPPQSSTYNATALFLNLPTTLTALTLTSIFSEPVTLDKLQKFTQLRSVILHDSSFVGDIPADFLASFPQLSNFAISKSSLTGTIPSTGWSSIEKFWIDAQVGAWDGIDSAPNLKRILITSPPLARLPSNEQFLAANLQSLVSFSIRMAQLTGLVPTFWNSLPKIEEVDLSQNLFSGPFNTTISSTSLILADFSQNQICGSLPDVSAPIRPDILRFYSNQFSGSIPDSWSTNLSYISELTFHSNPINGTVPDGLLHGTIETSNTNLVGPLWNMSQSDLVRIFVTNTGIDICAVDPEIPSGTVWCFFNNIPQCPQDCPSYWPCFNTPVCNPLNFTPQAVEECFIPPVPEAEPAPALFPESAPSSPQPAPSSPQPAPPSNQCPPPPPSGFICTDGQYISNGSVSFEVVTLPSEAGVIVVKGNLSINGTLTFSGLGSTIEVEGCVEVLPTEIHIVLTSLDPLPAKTLINQKGSNCAKDLSKIPVIVDERKDSCKRSKLSTSDSTRSALVVAFTIDSSRCNVKWIILGSVLGGVILLATVALLLLHLFSPEFRKLCKNNCRCKK